MPRIERNKTKQGGLLQTKLLEKKALKKKSKLFFSEYEKSVLSDSESTVSPEARKILDWLDSMSDISDFNETKENIQKLLDFCNYDSSKDQVDPFGDGDQSSMEECSEDTRLIFAKLPWCLGTFYSYALNGELSDFALACICGHANVVEMFILSTEEGSDERMKLLERRETHLRLSPLLITMWTYAWGESLSDDDNVDHEGVVKLLLRHGARPDAKCITGQTALFGLLRGEIPDEEQLRNGTAKGEVHPLCFNLGHLRQQMRKELQMN